MQEILNVLVLGSIYTLFALGLSLAWGVADILNLAHGALFVFGAVVALEVGERVALPLFLMLPVVMVAAAGVALLMDLLAFSPIARRTRTRSSQEMAILLASLGFAAILTNVANDATGYGIERIPEGVFDVTTFDVGSLTITNIQVVIVLAGLIATAAIAWWVKRSKQGRALRAVAFDRRVTPLFGINGSLLSRATLLVSGALAGAAGLLLAIHLSGFDASSGDALLLKAFAVIIVGGIGSVTGTALAAFGLAAIEIAVFQIAPGQAQDAVPFAIILLVLLIRPQGLFGSVTTERV